MQCVRNMFAVLLARGLQSLLATLHVAGKQHGHCALTINCFGASNLPDGTSDVHLPHELFYSASAMHKQRSILAVAACSPSRVLGPCDRTGGWSPEAISHARSQADPNSKSVHPPYRVNCKYHDEDGVKGCSDYCCRSTAAAAEWRGLLCTLACQQCSERDSFGVSTRLH